MIDLNFSKYSNLDLFRDLRKVSDLIFFEFSVLSVHVDNSGSQYLVSWVDSAESSDKNRWIIIPVHDKDLALYMSRQQSLLDCFNSARTGIVYLVDTDSQDFTSAVMLSPDQMPDDYKPSPEDFYEDTPILAPTNTFRVSIDGAWEPSEFKRFPEKFNEVYAVIGVNLDRYDDPNHYTSGGNYKSNLSNLLNILPVEKRPRFKSIRCASPGSIQITGDERLIGKTREAIVHFLNNRKEINKQYNVINTWLKAHDLKDTNQVEFPEFNNSIKRFSSLMRRLLDINDQGSLSNNPLSDLKILLALKRRLESIRSFVREEKVSFEEFLFLELS